MDEGFAAIAQKSPITDRALTFIEDFPVIPAFSMALPAGFSAFAGKRLL